MLRLKWCLASAKKAEKAVWVCLLLSCNLLVFWVSKKGWEPPGHTGDAPSISLPVCKERERCWCRGQGTTTEAAAAEHGGAAALPQRQCLCNACLWLPGVVLAVACVCAPVQALNLVWAGQTVPVSPCGVAPPCSVLVAVQRAMRGGCGARIRWRLHLPQWLFGKAGECTI